MARGNSIGVSAMIDDRTAEGVFRIDRGIYLDPAIFERALADLAAPARRRLAGSPSRCSSRGTRRASATPRAT